MDACSRLKVTQVGGIAGNLAMPPLIDLDREQLDQAGQDAMDRACRELIDAAAGSKAAPAIGADIGGYRVEITGGGQDRSFALPGPEATTGLNGQVDVPQVLAPLLSLSGAGR